MSAEKNSLKINRHNTHKAKLMSERLMGLMITHTFRIIIFGKLLNGPFSLLRLRKSFLMLS
jgi:hypothetical protein